MRLSRALSQRLGGLFDPGAQVGVDTTEHAVCIPADPLIRSAQVAGDVLDEVLLLAGCPAENLPEAVWLDEVLIHNRELLGDDRAGPLLVFLAGLDGLELERAEAGWVVGVGAVVAVDVHGTVTLVRVEGLERAVDGDLLVVGTEAVTVGVWVGEETGLENWVGGGLDTRDHVRGGEGGLLHLGEVVLEVPVEGHAAEASERDL